MGSGVSTLPFTKLRVEKEAESSSLSLVISIGTELNPIVFTESLLNTQLPIQLLNLSACRSTLATILKSRLHLDDGNTNYYSDFFGAFWKILERLDTDNEMVNILDLSTTGNNNNRNRGQAHHPPRNVILLRMLKCITSCAPTKLGEKVRNTGQVHASRGIKEVHIRKFCEALLRAIVFALSAPPASMTPAGVLATNASISHWINLLHFSMFHMIRGAELPNKDNLMVYADTDLIDVCTLSPAPVESCRTSCSSTYSITERMNIIDFSE